MSKTPFSKERHRFSLDAHRAAKEQIYPNILQTESTDLNFEYPGNNETDKDAVLDQDLSIDVTCLVSANHLQEPVHTTFQERWRGRKKDPREYMKYQDVTVTEINQITGSNSEHYKISSGFHLYGYYDRDIDKVLEAIAFSVPEWQLHVIQNNFNTGRNEHPSSKSSFISYDFSELKEMDVAVYHQKYDKVRYHFLDESR